MTTRYRIRRGWFGKAILQVQLNSPSFIGGVVDSSIRTYWWQDVDYDKTMYTEYYPNKESDHD